VALCEFENSRGVVNASRGAEWQGHRLLCRIRRFIGESALERLLCGRMRLNNLCLAILLAFSLMAVGQNIYLGNGANADWSTTANWQNGALVSGARPRVLPDRSPVRSSIAELWPDPLKPEAG